MKIKQGACFLCGSSDANTFYPNGSFCFSCNKPTGKTQVSPYAYKEEEEDDVKLPADASQEYSEVCLNWFRKYELIVPDLIKANVLWSESRKQILYPFYEQSAIFHETLSGYQARNFSQTAKTKYYTKGEVNQILPIYHRSINCDAPMLVVVEDCASAIKLSRFVDAVPCLGSDFTLYKINRVSKFYGHVLVWLDGNMYHKAQAIARKLEYVGVKSHAIYTSDDPKEIPYTELDNIIKEYL